MIQNKQLEQGVTPTPTRRSSPFQNNTFSDLWQIKDKSIVYISYRKRDRIHTITCQQSINSIGKINTVVNLLQMPKSIEEEDSVNQKSLFEIRKIECSQDPILKYHQKFYLIHRYSGLFLTCKQNLNSIILLELCNSTNVKAEFYCQMGEEQDRSSQYVSPNQSIKICSSYLPNRFANVLSSHNIHKDTISFGNQATLFNMNVYKTADSQPILTKTAYVQILTQDNFNNKQKLHIVFKNKFLDSNLNQPYSKYFKPENYELTTSKTRKAVWKVQLKSSQQKKQQHPYGHIRYGEQISFRCINTNLYLSFQIPNINILKLESQKKQTTFNATSSTIFKIERVISKINSLTGNQQSSIWLQSPIQINGRKFFIQEVNTVLGHTNLYNSEFQAAIQAIQNLDKLYFSGKYISETNQYLIKDKINIVSRYLILYQQLYHQITEDANSDTKYMDYDTLFVKSLMWLQTILKRNIVSVEKKSEEELLIEVLEGQFQKLIRDILVFILTSIPFVDSSNLQKHKFYNIVTSFLPKHKQIIELIFVQTKKVLKNNFGYYYLLDKINFNRSLKDKTEAGCIKIISKLVDLQQNLIENRVSELNTLQISLRLEEDKIFAKMYSCGFEVFHCELSSKLQNVVYDCLKMGFKMNKIPLQEIQSMFKGLKNLCVQQSIGIQYRIFILSMINMYLSMRINNKLNIACMRYENSKNDYRAFEMFVSTNFQGNLYQISTQSDTIIDSFLNFFRKKNIHDKLKNPIQYLQAMKQLFTLIQYYILLGNYQISRLLQIISFTLQCCEILNSYSNEQFCKIIRSLKREKQLYVKFQVSEIQSVIIGILNRQKYILERWTLSESKINKLDEEFITIKKQCFGLFGMIKNKKLFETIMELSIVRVKLQTNSIQMKQRFSKKKSHNRITSVKEIITHVNELFEKLQFTNNQTILKDKIQEGLKEISQLIEGVNIQFKKDKLELSHLQSLIRENGVYKHLCQLVLNHSKKVVNFSWKEMIQFLYNFCFGNSLNSRLLIPYQFQNLILGDQMDTLVTQIFIHAQSPFQILKLQKRLMLSQDIEHKIKFYRILLTLAHKMYQHGGEQSTGKKVVIMQILYRIQGFQQLTNQFRQIYKQSNKQPKPYSLQSIYSLEIHKTLIYLICELYQNIPVAGLCINKWFPTQDIVQVCLRPSELYWEVLKPYLYIVNNTLEYQNIYTINQVSIAVLKSFSYEIQKTIKDLYLHNDSFSKIYVWDILDRGLNSFQFYFTSNQNSESSSILPRSNESFWSLLYSQQEDCIRFGLLNFISSLLNFHLTNTHLSKFLMNELVSLNPFFQGILWVIEEIQKIYGQKKQEVSFTEIKKLLNQIISKIRQVNPLATRFLKQQYVSQNLFLEEEILQQSLTSLKPLVRQQKRHKSKPINLLIRHQAPNLFEHPIQSYDAEQQLCHSLIGSTINIGQASDEYCWQNIISYADLTNIQSLNFLKEFLQAYALYFEKSLSQKNQKFLIKLSEKLKLSQTQTSENSQTFVQCLVYKLKILKLILQIVFKYQNHDQLQKDFESFSLMIRNTFDFVLKSKCQWVILTEITSICTIYLSCLKDPMPEIKLLEQTFNNSNSHIEKLQLITKLFSTSMNIKGETALQLLSHQKICKQYYIAVMQICLKEELNVNNSQLRKAFSMLQVILQFNLFVIQNLEADIFESEYFNLLCQMKNKIVKERLQHDIKNIVGFKIFSADYKQSMTEDQFSVYLLLILITIQNVCEMVIPHNQKYLFNSSNDSFHQFYKEHLSQVELTYKGKNVTVCYPKFFDIRNNETKQFVIELVKLNERSSFHILMKAASLEYQGNQLKEPHSLITIIKNNKNAMSLINIAVLFLSTILLVSSGIYNLNKNHFSIQNFVLLFISLMLSLANCAVVIIGYIRQSMLQKKLIEKPNVEKDYKRFQQCFYAVSLLIFTILCFIFKILTALLLLFLICAKMNLKMHDSFFTEHTKKLGIITLTMVVVILSFLQFTQRKEGQNMVHFTENLMGYAFSTLTMPVSQKSWDLLRDLVFKVLFYIYVPAVFYSVMIIWKIAQKNTLSILKCLVCQKVFNHNSFSKHSIHKLSNYMSYFSFIFAREQPLNKLQEYIKLHISNNDIGLFPE